MGDPMTALDSDPPTSAIATTPRAMWRSLTGVAGAKVIVMGISGLLGIITSRIIIQNFGIDAYAQYGLLTALPSLIPFADLGIAAIVFNVIAGSEDPKHDENVRRTVVTAFRIMLITGPLIILVAVVISLLGLWPAILGNGLIEGGGIAALLCATVFGLVLPLTVGQRILVGLGKTQTQVATQLVIAPFILLSIVVLIALNAPAGTYIAVLSYVGAGFVSVLCMILAARSLAPVIGRAIRDIPRIRTVRNVAFIAIAGPNLVQTVILPLATQGDRLLLSHLTTGDELAQYNLASQLFGIALQTIAAAGLALWPIYAKARASQNIQSPLKTSLVFLAGGLLLGGVMAAVAPWIVDFLTDGKITLDGWLIVGFVVFVGVQASKYPLGMYMTDARGLKFQMIPIIIMLPVNISLTWYLIGVLGPAGPVISGAFSALVCQVLPYLWYVTRDLRRRRSLLAAELNGADS